MYGANLPGYWCLNFYNNELKNINTLNQNILESQSNPFRSDSSINVQGVNDLLQSVIFFVVDRATENLDYVTSSGMNTFEE